MPVQQPLAQHRSPPREDVPKLDLENLKMYQIRAMNKEMNDKNHIQEKNTQEPQQSGSNDTDKEKIPSGGDPYKEGF